MSDVRPEELDVVPDGLGHLPVDARQRTQRVVELDPLELDAGEPECGLVAHGLVDGPSSTALMARPARRCIR